MAYQEVTRQSYGSKVKGGFQGILWGLILIIAGTVILWWNEGRAVKASDALKDFQKNYVEMPDINTVNPEFEGKAVHATGVATTADTLRDAAFGIAVNAFRLCRDVEYYQWKEKSSSESKDKLGGSTETTTTYTYEPGWSSEPVNSAEFKDPDYKGKNFVWRVVEDADQYAANATFGAYRLTDGIISSISGEEPVQPALTEEQMKQLLAKVSDSTVVVTILGNQVYIGADPDTPHIGDVRITFNQVTSPKTISLLQKVVNGTFESYIAKNGKAFSKVEMGTVSAENMIEHQKAANKVWLWVLRILGAILVIAGNKGLLGFLSVVFAVVPFVQRIVGAGVGLVATVVGLVWSIIVIALAWVAHRPVLAISLLVVAAALVVWLVMRARKKKASDAAALLIVCLMVGLAGCTGGNTAGNGGDGNAVASAVVKGPVRTVEVTQYYGEGEPATTTYQYDEKGNVISENTEWDGDIEEYERIEALCEKDAKGNYTKEVYGFDGVSDEIITHVFDEDGHDILCESHRADGSWNYTQTSRFDTNGHLVENVTRNNYGQYANLYEYDAEGHQVKSTYISNGTLYSTTETQYNEKGQDIYRKESYPQMERVNETYTTYDESGEQNGYRCYVTDKEGYRLSHSDSTYTDKKGFVHQRQYSNYEGRPKTMDGTFNKEQYLTHYEYFEGNAASPSLTVDFNYEKDGSTLRDVVWKELSLGQVKNTRTYSCPPRYDTFGNWIRRTHGMNYLFDGEYTKFEDLENYLSQAVRKITYRGDDQGQNYGFEGKAGNADLRLTFTEDDGVCFGNLYLDGNIWRAVGRTDKDGSQYFVALMEEGDIPWSLSIPAGEGKRTATLFDLSGNQELTVTLNPTRKDLQTYSFATKSDDLVGLYRYEFKDGSASGELDVSRCGEDWEDLHYAIENVWYSSFPKIANEEQTEFLGNQTEFGIYRWCEEGEGSVEYKLRFFDGFAIIQLVRGDPSLFYPLGTTIAGIYAKLPSVG